MSYQLSPAPADPVAAWLRRRFPERNEFAAEIAEMIGSASVPLLARRPDPALFGRWFERVLALDLSETPPYQELIAALPLRLATQLVTSAGYRRLDGPPEADWRRWRRPGPAMVERLVAVAAGLVEIDRLYWRHCHRDLENLAGLLGVVLSSRTYLRHLMSDMRPSRPALAVFADSYQHGFRDLLRGWGPCIAAPALCEGRRTADLILGTTLLELKTGSLTAAGDIDHLIDQLLAYGLLACTDGYPVTHVGVYLARYQVVRRWPLPELLHQLAGRDVDAPAEATTLAAIINSQSRRLAA